MHSFFRRPPLAGPRNAVGLEPPAGEWPVAGESGVLTELVRVLAHDVGMWSRSIKTRSVHYCIHGALEGKQLIVRSSRHSLSGSAAALAVRVPFSFGELEMGVIPS